MKLKDIFSFKTERYILKIFILNNIDCYFLLDNKTAKEINTSFSEVQSI